jgi:ribosomal protein L23
MLITPRISEKSYKLAAAGTYVFDVPMSANKAEVLKALKQEYPDVKFGDVRLLVQNGKRKAVNKGKRARPGYTTLTDTKKAYAGVLDGKIEVAQFSDLESQMPEEEKAEIATEAKPTAKIAAGAETKRAGLLGRRRTGNRGDK